MLIGENNMTIEEKAREEYPYITPSDGYECHDYNEAAKDGFIEGAKWMLEEAADWIIDNIVFDKFGRSINIEIFRKAMEG